MSKLFVSEFGDFAFQGGSRVPALVAPPLTSEVVNIGGGSVQSSAFAANTKLLRVHADAICSIKIGADPVATTDDMRMGADQTEYFVVEAGDKIAVIANT